jgi:cytochrome c peroxidase
MFPVTSHDEMRGQPGSNTDLADAPDNEGVWRALMVRLVGTEAGGGGFAAYRALFAAAYPSVSGVDALTFGHAARAIASYERHAFTAVDTPLDRYLAGDPSALSDAEKRGGLLFFGRARCGECHRGPLLTDLEHHAMCVPQLGPGKEMPSEDLGLSLLTLDAADDYKFRTPGLRNVALTGPWMHDGAFTTLEETVRHELDPAGSLLSYDAGQLPPLFAATLDLDGARRDARVAATDPVMTLPVDLTPAEFADLMAFLHALTDPSSLSLLDQIPGSVPSGLPVAD